MKRPTKLSPSLERVLTAAAALTLEEWTTVYWRYVDSPAILKAVRKFHGVAAQAHLNALRLVPIEKMGKRDPVIVAGNARIDEIVSPLPEVELDPRGEYLRHRVEWFLVHTRQALDYAELLNADPACRKAVQTFLSIFDGLIDFPEFR